MKMKLWLQTLYTAILLAILGSACQSSMPAGIYPTSSNSEKPTMVISSATTQSTRMNSSTSTPTMIATSKFDFSCWPLKTLEQGNTIIGQMLYANYPYKSGQQVNDFFAWDLNTFQSTPIKLASHSFRVDNPVYYSPDGKLAAWISGNKIMIASQNDIRSFSLPTDNLKIRTYLADGKLLLDLVDNTSNYQKESGLTNIYYLFDFLTGKTAKYSVFLPNFVLGGDFWASQYSPDMKYILYKSSPDEQNTQFTLYDLEKNKIVWVGPPRDSSLISITVPAWQPDSSALTIIYKEKTGYRSYYSISLDGKVSQMDNFNGAELDSTARSKVWSSNAVVGSASWSPNGQYLASTGYPNKVHQALSSLYIWNNQAKVLYKPCIPNEEKRISVPYGITWSFDGIHALVSLTFLRTETPIEVIPGNYMPDYVTKNYILNLVDKVIYEVPDFTSNDAFVQNKNGYNMFLGWVNWEIP